MTYKRDIRACNQGNQQSNEHCAHNTKRSVQEVGELIKLAQP